MRFKITHKLDLALPPAEHAEGITIEGVAHVVADVAPILQRWPALKLSFPVARGFLAGAGDRQQLANCLKDAAVASGQLVAAIDARGSGMSQARDESSGPSGLSLSTSDVALCSAGLTGFCYRVRQMLL